MPLQTQTLPIVLTAGLDTKSDPKNVAVGRLTTLENGVFTAPGRINKRHGYDALGTDIQGSTSKVTAARALLSFNDELLLCDGQRMYSYSQSSEKWLDKGAAVSITTSVNSVIRDSHTQSNPDSAVNAGVRVTAWEDSRGGVRCAVQDATTGAFYSQDVSVSASGARPRVVAFGRDLVIFYCVSNNLFYRRIGVTSPTVLGGEVNPISTLVVAANTFDVLVIGSRLFIAYNSSDGAPATYLAYLSTAYGLTAIGSILGVACTSAVGMFSDADQDVYVIIASASLVRVVVATYAGVSLGSFNVESVGFTVKTVCGYVESGASLARNTGKAHVFYELSQDATQSHDYIRTCALDLAAGLPGTVTDFKRSVGLASRWFSYGSGFYVVTAYQSQLQSTYFVLDSTGAVVAKVNPATGGGLRTSATIANVYAPSTAGVFEFACGQQSRLAIQGGVLYAFTGATVATLDFVDVNAFSAAKINSNILVGGGIVQSYDGVSLTEAGFHLFPESLQVSEITPLTITVTTNGDASHKETTDFLFAGTGRIAPGQYWTQSTTTLNLYVWFSVDGVGTDPALPGKTGIKVSIANGDGASAVATAVNAAINAAGLDVTSTVSTATVTTTNASNGAVTHAAIPAAPAGVGTGLASGAVQYTAIYEWADNYGQIVRSAPSVALSHAVTTGSVTVQVPTLRVTARDGVTRSAARVVIYRTTDAGTIPYRLTSLTSPLLNSTSVDSVYYADTAADSPIVGNEILYTFGGILEDDPPPPAAYVVTFKNRAIVAGGQDKNTIAFSQQTSTTDPVSFNDALTIAIDQRGGDITSLGVMDDKLIVFKRTSIFVMDGEGPNNAGQGSSFSVPSLVASDVGCISQQSVVLTENGILFQSAKGFYLLDRSLSAQYIGAPVEAYNSLTVTGAELVPSTNQVRFTTTSDACLVYDYLVGQWSVFTNHASAGCAVLSDVFYLAKPSGIVWKENPASFVDAGNQIVRLRLVTGWLSFAGIQGFQRVRNALILGDYKGPHSLVVQVGTDYSPAFSQYAVIPATSLVASSTYGSDPLYGSSPVYGGYYTPYQFRCHVKNQKCEAIRFSIEDAQSSAYNEGYSINALTLEIAVKQGAVKVPSARSF